MAIHEKLLHIQQELKAPKGQFNSFGKYRYRSCEDILEAAKPIVHRHGCALAVGDKLVSMGDRYYIEATAVLYDTTDGKSISNTAYAREDESKKGMDGSQITGTASSYARKYALNGLFCIDDTKDADTDEHAKQTSKGDTKQPTEKCSDCGCDIVDGTKRNGDTWLSEDIVAYSRKRFDRTLCPSCQREAFKAEEKPSESQN